MAVIGHPECKGRGASVSTVWSGEGGESHLPETHSDAAQRGTTGFAEEGSAYLKNQDGKAAGNLCSSVVSHYAVKGIKRMRNLVPWAGLSGGVERGKQI